MSQLPRGIAPDLLVSQVRNTMPYLFEPEVDAKLAAFPPARTLRASAELLPEELSHFEYFRLCLSSHYLSCGTPVPTDVDNQIRQKLWPKQLPLETALEMGALVLESRGWDFTQVSARHVYGAKGSACEREPLSGHLGEWFTVACGAYGGLKQYGAPEAEALRSKLADAIADEVKRHGEIFASLWKAGDGLGCLKASASIAHNLGDLDRVMDMWELQPNDPLRVAHYKLGSLPFDADKKLRHQGRLWVAGELYKSPIEGSSMALENHRHYALRKPRALRLAREYLIPNGPFFDGWGERVARGLGEGEAFDEVVEALTTGWDRQPKSAGYGRGLRGILEVFPRIDQEPMLRGQGHKAVLTMSREKFERRWADEALRLMDDIPSRA